MLPERITPSLRLPPAGKEGGEGSMSFAQMCVCVCVCVLSAQLFPGIPALQDLCIVDTRQTHPQANTGMTQHMPNVPAPARPA